MRLARAFWPASLRAGAATVVVCGLILATACAASPESPVASAPHAAPPPRSGPPLDAPVEQTVGFSPGREWLGLGQVSLVADGPAPVRGTSTVVLTPVDTPDGPVVFAQRVDEPPPSVDGHDPEDHPEAVPATAGDLAGLAGLHEATGHRWLSVGRGARRVDLWAGPDVSADELVSIAAAVDLAHPIAGQGPFAGWAPFTTSTQALGAATVRQVHASLAGGGASIQVSAWRGVGAGAESLVGDAPVARRQWVRGGEGFITVGTSGSDVTVTWREDDDLIGQLRLVTAYELDSDELVRMAIEEARRLIRLDKSGWRRLGETASRRITSISGGAAEVNPPRTVFVGSLLDGRRYTLTERRGLFLCIEVEGLNGVERCDSRLQLWRRSTNEAMPRMIDPGDPTDARSPVVLYGYLPTTTPPGTDGETQGALGPWLDPGRATAVHVVDRRGRDLGWGTIVDHVWVHHIHDNDLPLIVTYHFPDGSSLEVVPGREYNEGEPG